MAHIITRNYRSGSSCITVRCPWCGHRVTLNSKTAVECTCGALHRWNRITVYHIPSVRHPRRINHDR